MLIPLELVAWWVKHHSLRLHVLFNRKNNNNNEAENGIEGGPLIYLFIAHDKHIDLLIENFEVLVIDLTYKTNIF